MIFKQVLEFIQSFEVMNAVLNYEMARKCTYFLNSITINIAEYAVVNIKTIQNDIIMEIALINQKDSYREHTDIMNKVRSCKDLKKMKKVVYREESCVIYFDDFSQFLESFNQIIVD